MPISVTGMHRSGTSMAARLLQLCGLYLGPDQDLMPPGPDNPSGYWENIKFVEINTEILDKLGAGWDHPPSDRVWANKNTEKIMPHLEMTAENLLQEFRENSPWGWKDPRTSLLIPFWLRLLPDLKVVVCLRNPLEVALSLHRRNYSSYSLGLALWKTYNQHILATTQPEQRLVTHYDAYFHNPQTELQRVLDFLQISVSEEILQQATSEINADLHHNRFTTRHLLDCDVASDIFNLYIQLCHLAEWPHDEENRHINGGGLHQPKKRNLVEAPVAEENEARGIQQLNKSALEAELLRRELTNRNATIQALQGQIERDQQERKDLSKSLTELATKFQHILGNTDIVQAKLQKFNDELSWDREVEQPTGYSKLQQNLLVQGVGSGQDIAVSQQLVRRIQEVVRTDLPNEAAVIVVNNGDSALLNLTGCTVLPFPQTVGSVYDPNNSPDSGAAIAHLEVLRSKGGQFLLLPITQFWWFSQYDRFKRYLEERYRVITHQEDACIIFDLQKPMDSASSSGWVEFEEMNSEIQRRLGRYPAILDWNTGLDLAAKFPHCAVFSPPTSDDSTLPYLDHSVEVVAVPPSNSAVSAEAARVAQTAVISLTKQSNESALTCAVTWLEELAPEFPTVSIIIPSYNKIDYTEKCLVALQETLPRSFRGEIIVVDDASTDETAARLDELVDIEKRLKVVSTPQNVGFILACNRGAEVASSEIIIFLNNDTIPLPGWFQPLLQVFDNYRDAGAVGGKLIYPDGRLQEAGSVIFADGSGLNFGKGDYRVDDPLYNYVREVDYCSGALLATKRSLFIESGGFDTSYCPAYYEDVDYCFSLRAQGYRVYYQPESSIIHFEGISQGTDLSGGIKQYQTINQVNFVKKWEHSLKQYPAPPDQLDATTWHTLAVRSELSESGPSIRPKRALVVAPLMPEYDRESGSRRVFHIIEFLREAGWTVSFVAQHGDGGERYAHLLRQKRVGVYIGSNTRTDQLITAGQFDLAILTFWHIGEFYLDKLRRLSPATRIVIDSIDLHFLRNARHIFHQTTENQNDRLDSDYAADMIREINTYAAADAVLAVSQKEANLINDLTSDPKLAYTVPLSEDLKPSKLPFTKRKGILFIGNFRHPPNIEAVAYLCCDILPKLDPTHLAEHPIYIVGNALDETVRGYAQNLPQVKMIGWVPSLLPYLQQVRITIVPLLHGAGTKGKLIQALFVGTPSVSTRIGIEGLNLRDKEHILVADDPTDFADSIVRLLTNAELWHDLAQRGQEHIKSIHDKEAVQERFRNVIAAVLAKESKPLVSATKNR